MSREGHFRSILCISFNGLCSMYVTGTTSVFIIIKHFRVEFGIISYCNAVINDYGKLVHWSFLHITRVKLNVKYCTLHGIFIFTMSLVVDNIIIINAKRKLFKFSIFEITSTVLLLFDEL